MTQVVPESGETYRNVAFDDLDLSRGEYRDCVFEDCSFVGTNFRAADLSGSRFEKCQFNDADSDTPADLSHANLKEASFDRCNLTVVDCIGIKGYALVMSHCQLQGADLSKSDFRLPIADGDLTEVTIEHCNLSYANLSNNYLVDAVLRDNRLTECSLDYTDLSQADLRGSELYNISAIGVTLIGADLRGASFNNLNPRDIELTDVKITPEQVGTLLEGLGIIVLDDAE